MQYIVVLTKVLELDLHVMYSTVGTVAVADPGFDLRGGVDFVNWGGGVEKSLKMSTFEV